MPKTDKEVEILHLDDEAEDVIPFRYSITSYGADYPIDGLHRRVLSGDIFIPEFQRQYVWSIRQASRFIESLLLGLPVPGIFLAKESDTQKLLVIDGQQRLRTIEYLFEGVFEPNGREFRLVNVQPKLEGLTYKTLTDEDRRLLNDSIVHATIVRQDEPSEDNSSIYHIFERLNAGGVLLQPQEIRACNYHGDFVHLLKLLNDNAAWRDIFGAKSRRMRDQELILRFLALFFLRKDYRRPMKDFLNDFLSRNRHLVH